MANHRIVEDIPDTSQAEEWLSEDVFIFKGRLWEVKPNGEVVPCKGVDHASMPIH